MTPTAACWRANTVDIFQAIPNVVPKNMPGSGGLKVANYIYNAVPSNGLEQGDGFGEAERGEPVTKQGFRPRDVQDLVEQPITERP